MKNSATLKSLVIQEAVNIKKHASRREVNRLDFDRLNPATITDCIYGQMTGNCYSSRASELICKSAKRVYKIGLNATTLFDDLKLNGKPKPSDRKSQYDSKFFSPIEVFIHNNKGRDVKNQPLVEFLKSEISLSEFKKSML